VARRPGGLFLIRADRRAQHALALLRDLSPVIIATAGLWLLWSQYSYLSGLSWWYDSVQHLRARGAGPTPDYDLTTLPWKATVARAFEVRPDGVKLITNGDPFAYQALATIRSYGANAADLQFDADVEAGGITIGLLQAGTWIAINSMQHPGSFADWNSAQLGYRRSLTVVIANDNPAGESRVTIKSLRLFLRK
jgi:hypothetical protein